MNNILIEANELSTYLSEIRRYLHANPGVGFDVEKSIEKVKAELEAIGIMPQKCGRAGIVATLGNRGVGKCVLLRADMDALEISEESGEDFASKNGKMHACGHDMHTSMLLGAARLLKAHEAALNGEVLLVFQPAEEILEGAKDMIDDGLLDNKSISAAIMLHVMTGVPIECGTAIIAPAGVSAPAAAMFEIKINGKGCHGSMPEKGRDPIICGAHIASALCEINARELASSQKAALTLGVFNAGNSANVIPDTALLKGSVRAFDQTVFEFMKQRICEISTGIASVFRTSAEVDFTSECPTLINNAGLADDIKLYLGELLGSKAIDASDMGDGSSGSEDFAYISHKVPSVMIALAAGDCRCGYAHPLHHPGVRFDESALPTGAAIYAYSALNLLG
ncbi:MAG: amidohydrolase [Clostridia bacterium]|nr:amidohydrolase [Clostridia bacterium]